MARTRVVDNNNTLYELVLSELMINDEIRQHLLNDAGFKKTELEFLIKKFEGKLSIKDVMFKSPEDFSTIAFNRSAVNADGIVTAAFRLPKVGADVYANGDNDDTTTVVSLFNQIMYKAGDPKNGLAAGGITSLVVNLLMYVLACAATCYQVSHELKLASLNYVLECLKKIDPSYENYEGSLLEDMKIILRAKLESDRTFIRIWKERESEKKRRKQEEVANHYLDDPSARLLGKDVVIEAPSILQTKIMLGKVPSHTDFIAGMSEEEKDKYKPNSAIRFIHWLLSESHFAVISKKIWSIVNDPTYMFWLTWVPLGLLIAAGITPLLPVLAPLAGAFLIAIPLGFGFFVPVAELLIKLGVSKSTSYIVASIVSVAVMLALGFLIPIVGPTLIYGVIGLGAAVGLGLIVKKIYDYSKERQQEKNEKRQKELAVERTPEEKAADLKSLATNQANNIAPELERQLHQVRLHRIMQAEHHLQLRKLQGIKSGQKVAMRKRQQSIAQYGYEGDGFDIAGYLNGSAGERYFRLFLTGFTSIFGGIIAASFIAWFAGTITATIGPALLAVTTFLGQTSIYTIAGAVLGGLFSLRDVAKMRTEQLKFEQEARAILDAPYMRVNDNHNIEHLLIEDGKPFLTNEEVFKRLFAENERLTDELDANVGAKRIKKKYNYNINRNEVFNDRFWRKLEYKPDGFSLFKRVLTYFKTGLFSAESGVFLGRLAFLKNFPGLLASAAGGIAIPIFAATGGAALIPFIIACIVIGVVYGVIGVVNYQLQRNQEDRVLRVKTLSDRMSYLKKLIKEKELVCEKYGLSVVGQQNENATAQSLPINTSRLRDKEIINIDEGASLTDGTDLTGSIASTSTEEHFDASHKFDNASLAIALTGVSDNMADCKSMEVIALFAKMDGKPLVKQGIGMFAPAMRDHMPEPLIDNVSPLALSIV